MVGGGGSLEAALAVHFLGHLLGVPLRRPCRREAVWQVWVRGAHGLELQVGHWQLDCSDVSFRVKLAMVTHVLVPLQR